MRWTRRQCELFPNKKVKVCGGVETDTGSKPQDIYGRLRCPILGHRYASFAHITGREDPPPHWPSGCSTEPLRDESNRAAPTKAEMNRGGELTALQSFNERAAITKFSAVGTWESISISPPFFLKRQWLRVHSAHETSDQWLLAVAIVCLAPPIHRQCISGSCWDLRKMSLPDTVLFWFRSQIAWLSFYIDNKEMVAFPRLYSLRLVSLWGERDWSFCASYY